MIALDTCVVSELTKADPSAKVVAWLGANSAELWLTAIVIAELSAGTEVLPEGARKSALLESLNGIRAAYRSRTLSLGAESAVIYGRVLAKRKSAGRPVGTMDALTAAICLSNGASLATRNVADFEGLGLDLINPFD